MAALLCLRYRQELLIKQQNVSLLFYIVRSSAECGATLRGTYYFTFL